MSEKPLNSDAKLHRKFAGLWWRARSLPSLTKLSAETVATWAELAGLNVLDTVERNVGIFRTTPAIVLTVDGGTAYFPKVSATDDPAWLSNKQACERIASLWSKVEWFEPLWVSRG